MQKLFKDVSKRIKVYPGIVSTTDPYEGTKSISYLNPIPISALVWDLSPSKIQWSLQGLNTDKAKKVMVLKQHRALVEMSCKFQVLNDGTDFYEGWLLDGRLNILEEGDFIIFVIYIKKV